MVEVMSELENLLHSLNNKYPDSYYLSVEREKHLESAKPNNYFLTDPESSNLVQ